jgi:triacylglycerol lipase
MKETLSEKRIGIFFFFCLFLSLSFFFFREEGRGKERDAIEEAVSFTKRTVQNIKEEERSYREEYGEYIRYKNISYPSAYPYNSYDAYLYPKERRGEVLGTILYLHGGGFVSGSKNVVDQHPYFQEWLKEGFQIIAIDYALAPDYPYPIALQQVASAINSILQKQDVLGINPQKLLILGDSAGAALGGQFLLSQENGSYRKKLKMKNVLRGGKGKVIAFISLSGLLDTTRYDQTNLKENNSYFRNWGIAYFQEQSLEKGKKAREASVLLNLSQSFPPSFLSDGNIGSFQDQGKDFQKKLRQMGVRVECYFPGKAEGELPHDFELQIHRPEAARLLKKQIAFVKSLAS